MPANERRPIASVLVDWRNRQGVLLSLEISEQFGDGTRLITGPGSSEIVTLNGQPAALVRGAWNADKQEFDADDRHLRLLWEGEGLVYTLGGYDANITPEVLIRMAESIP